jgi:DNA-binding NarL/FixJ family response regulator
VRVVIGEDSVLLRAGLDRLLTDGGFEVVGGAGDLHAVVSLVDATRPDVAVLDIRMPPTFTDEGLVAARRIRSLDAPTPGCLVLSQHVDARFGLELVSRASGGLGYLLKERVADVDDFLDAVRRVGRGGSIVDPEIVRLVVERRRRDVLVDLTEREREVLELMAQGRSNASISRSLGVGAKTVEARINTIFSKLGLEPAEDDNRRVLAVLALLRGPSFAGEGRTQPASAPTRERSARET